MPSKTQALVPAELIERRIFLVRGHKVLLDAHLAELYEVEVRTLNQAVTRNRARFPKDFMFRLSAEEWAALRSQIVILKPGRGQQTKYRPRAFTEQGIAMLSGVLKSERAVEVNIAIMRTFVQMREMLASHADLARRLDELEQHYDAQFAVVFDAIRELMGPAEVPPSQRIGFGDNES